MNYFKKSIHYLIPKVFRDLVRRQVERVKYFGLSRQEIFQKIYDDSVWGKSNSHLGPYCSGIGSQEGTIVDDYVEAIKKFASSIGSGLNAVDVGCGDFTVGAKTRKLFKDYTACDIVKPLIEFNRQKYADLDVKFQILDAVTDDLPMGDVLIIRQVLQHLSNSEIAEIVSKVAGKFAYLVVTEHVPDVPAFVPNKEKPTGPGIRVEKNSGVVLTSPPFNLKCKSEEVICEVKISNGTVRTVAYNL
jgi:Methyltransferase domain